jgi:hypothetical protein
VVLLRTTTLLISILNHWLKFSVSTFVSELRTGKVSQGNDTFLVSAELGRCNGGKAGLSEKIISAKHLTSQTN